MLINELTHVGSVSEYLSVLESVPTQVPGEPGTYCCQLVFRGQPDIAYELLPTIGRGGRAWLPDKGYVSVEPKGLANESNYIAAACQRLPSLFNDGLSPIDLLARLQHYGIPTRLLDVTTNALAALYFACSGNRDNESSSAGEVIVFRCPAYDLVDYPISQVIADSWRILPNAGTLSSFVQRAIGQPYFRYQTSDVRGDAGELGDWVAQCCGQLLFVRGSASLDRQSAQSGMYILFPNAIEGHDSEGARDDRLPKFGSRIEEIPKDHKAIAARIAVDGNSKKATIPLCTLGMESGSAPRLAGVLGIELPVPERFRG